MENLPSYISLLFISTTLLTLWFFYYAIRSAKTIVVALVWLTAQALISIALFYTDTTTMPPRFLMLLVPPLIGITVLFTTTWGKRLIADMDIKWCTLLHMVRIPVEIVLYLLFVNGKVPEVMTFAGRNFDIAAGITAPLILLLLNDAARYRRILLLWNIVCLLLLINVVVHAILSSPLPFQQMAFEQPNIAVLYFPYVWLPCFIVPVVLLCHLATISKLSNLKT